MQFWHEWEGFGFCCYVVFCFFLTSFRFNFWYCLTQHTDKCWRCLFLQLLHYSVNRSFPCGFTSFWSCWKCPSRLIQYLTLAYVFIIETWNNWKCTSCSQNWKWLEWNWWNSAEICMHSAFDNPAAIRMVLFLCRWSRWPHTEVDAVWTIQTARVVISTTSYTD